MPLTEIPFLFREDALERLGQMLPLHHLGKAERLDRSETTNLVLTAHCGCSALLQPLRYDADDATSSSWGQEGRNPRRNGQIDVKIAS